MTIDIPFVEKLYPMINPVNKYNVIPGGRGSGKSQFMRDLFIVKACTERDVTFLCVKGTMSALKDSVIKLLTDGVKKYGLQDQFQVSKSRTSGFYLENINTGSKFIFGGLQNPDETFSFIADNAIKGISSAVALTMHANPQFSLEHWDTSTDDVQRLLLERASPWIGDATVITSQIKKWRLATPLTIWPERYWASDMIVLAGDAFGGPKIEGAALSGLAAANYLQEII